MLPIPSQKKSNTELFQLKEKQDTPFISNQLEKRTMMSSSSAYNKVRVEDLLNKESEPAKSHHTIRRPGIICHLDGCGRQFVSHESLVAHQKRSHAAPTSFICPHCELSYSTVPNLNKHVSLTLYEFQET